MKFEIYSGDFVGTAEWQGPGRVEVEVEDPDRRAWFESYFSQEDSTLQGPVESAELSSAERRDSSEHSFGLAIYQLAAYSYNVRPDGRAEPEQGGT
jgi:hypothetical protein